MNTERICPNCRKTLATDAPLGLCPECLIKSGFPTGTEPAAAATARFVPPPVTEIAGLFLQLEILNFIGQGGMGAVYKARQPALDRFVALKILPPAMGSDPGFAERFNREARALARLNHPNIVAVHDFGQAGPLHYLLMEFVDGANLREIERAGKLAPNQALNIVPQICEALQFAHNEGIVHRDIKPENLLIDKKGRLKITDFGIAKIIGVGTGKSTLTGERDVVGTPHYMAPEQIENPQAVDHRADIYSLGVVFYEMLTGELPLGKFSPPSQKAAMDTRLDEVVMHTLEKEPTERYQQASQVKTDVETIAATTAPLTSTPKPAGQPGTPSPGSRIPPLSVGPTPGTMPAGPEVSDKLILPAFLLAFFFGVFGAHRLYVGKIGTGLAQAGCFFGGIFMIVLCIPTHLIEEHLIPVFSVAMAMFIVAGAVWAVIDCILLLCKAFTDSQGRRLTKWVHGDATTTARPATASGSPPPLTTAAAAAAGAATAAGLAANAPSPNPPPGGAPPNSPASGGGGGTGGGGPFGASGPFGEANPFGGKPKPGDSSNAMITAPAIGLIIAGVYKLFSALKVLFFFSVGDQMIHSFLPQFNLDFPAPVSGLNGLYGIGAVLFIAVPAVLMIFGGVEMFRLRSYAWSVAAAIIAVMACSLIGLPVGIWAFIILMQSGVRERFSNAPVAISATKWLAAGFILITGLCVLALALGFLSKSSARASSFARVIGAHQADYQSATAPTPPTPPTPLTPPVPPVPSVPSVAPAPNTYSNSLTIEVGDQTDFSKSFVTQPGGTLDVNVDSGEIKVLAADQNDLAVKITREVSNANSTSAEAYLIGENLSLRLDGNHFTIAARQPPRLHSTSWWGWVDQPNLNAHYEITVPRQFDIQLTTSGGGEQVSGLNGRVKLNTSGGELICHDIIGDINAQTSGGDVHAEGCQGGLRLDTSGGSITIGNFTGPGLNATTSGGNIDAEFATTPKTDCDLQTSGGNISVTLPADTKVNLDAHTSGGMVNTELPVEMAGQLDDGTLIGPINGGGPRLKLGTSGGNIDLRKH